MVDNLGDRMKMYEDTFRHYLPNRTPLIIRVDGKAFHTLLRKAKKPFDEEFITAMNETAKALLENIQGAFFVYVQSDEISIFVNTYFSERYSPWFDNNIQKIVSISASIASVTFSQNYKELGLFDSRVFMLPKDEVNNYFIWRQSDWTRNSVQMMARTVYSQKELHGKKNSELHELMFQKGVNWDKLPTHLKRGRGFYKLSKVIAPNVIRTEIVQDNELPIFSQDRGYIQKFVDYKVEE